MHLSYSLRVSYGYNLLDKLSDREATLSPPAVPECLCKDVIRNALCLTLQIAACMLQIWLQWSQQKQRGFFFLYFLSFSLALFHSHANHTAPKWRPELVLIFRDFEKEAPCGHHSATAFTCCTLAADDKQTLSLFFNFSTKQNHSGAGKDRDDNHQHNNSTFVFLSAFPQTLYQIGRNISE